MPAPTSAAAADDLLRTLLDVSLTGLLLLRPEYAPNGTDVRGWAYEHVNPAAQRLLGLPAHPAEILLADTAREQAADLFAFYCAAFGTGEERHYRGRYQPAGAAPAPLLHLAARRQGERLVVSLSAVAAEQPAAPAGLPVMAPAAHGQGLLQAVFNQAPVAIALFQGPDQVVAQANALICDLWDYPPEQVIGRPLLDAVPEVRDQGFAELLAEVARTGTPFVGKEMPARLRQHGRLETRYFNFVYQPLYAPDGALLGVLDIASDVTAQVTDRGRVQELNEELAAANEELRTINEELSISNSELTHVQLQLQQLNQELEARVAERTGALEQAKTEMERSAQQFQMLTNSIDQLVWTATAAGVVDYYSPQWYRYVGRPLTADPDWAAYLHPADLTRVSQRWQQAVVDRTPYYIEARLRAADGEYRWFLGRALPLRDAAGGVVRWVGTNTDIHEQKTQQLRLVESEQHFRRMADSVPAMLWITAPDGQCTYLNRQWYATTGQTEATALGVGWLSAVHPDDVAATRQAFEEANARHAAFHLFYRLRHHDGHYRWAIDSGLPRFGADGAYDGFVGTVVDTHEQKLAEQDLRRLTQKLRLARDQAQSLNTELRTTNDRLARTNVDLDNFVYVASHDLKSPITNIEGLLALLREQLPAATLRDPEIGPVLTMMQGAVDRFTRTIGELSDVTRLSQEPAPPTTLVALAPVLDDVRLDLQPLLAQPGARLDVDLDGGREVAFSARNLRSVLYNLLSNALKYRHPARPPHVRVGCRTEGDYTVLSVQDNGLGLTPDQQAELFTMFRRLHGHVEGSGIGLYVVKRSVENAGGKVKVVSELGVGSTFSVYFKR